MKTLLFLLLPLVTFAQPWSPSGTCDFTDGQQWNNGGAKGCACTWYDLAGNLNCAFGDCGQNALFECVYDCNGHNGYATDQTPRQCDATATPICWFNGSGSQGELFCQNIALPIELTDFSGIASENNIELFWTTASELDNDYFEIWHSVDGIVYTLLYKMQGAGTTTMPQLYRFIHVDAPRGVNYYKLSQTDYNGDTETYGTIAVKNIFSNSNTMFSDIYPNPGSDNFFFNYSGDRFNTPIQIRIIDQFGHCLLVGETDNFNNSVAISFNLNGVAAGIYIVEITQDTHTEIKRVTVL